MANMRESSGRTGQKLRSSYCLNRMSICSFCNFLLIYMVCRFPMRRLVFRENSKLTKVATAAGWNSMGIVYSGW